MRHTQTRHASVTPSASPKQAVGARIVATVAGAGLVLVGLAAVSSGADAARGASDAARGLVYQELTAASTGPCAGGYVVTTVGGKASCSHGPDPAPRGRDVRASRTVADLTASISTTASKSGSVQCIGDGTSGPRVQAVYAVASDQTDRYASIAPLIAGWAGQMDGVFAQSAALTGGERHIRFVTNPDCTLNVQRVTLTAAGDDTFTNTVTQLRNQGFTRTDRKYVVWSDALVYCGISQLAGNDWAGASNSANSGPTIARIDSGCWGRSDHLSEVHELVHTLGGVQSTAPHATAGYHCTDESDALCYADAPDVFTTAVCPAEDEWLLDCNHDDYFNTSPPSGSYLATHWNVADSVFLSQSASGTAPDSAPPSSTSTAVFTGSLSSKRPTKSFAITVGAGPASTSLSFTASGRSKSSATATVTVRDSAGNPVATGTGGSVLREAATLTAGAYTWEVSSTSSVSFTMTVDYVAP